MAGGDQWDAEQRPPTGDCAALDLRGTELAVWIGCGGTAGVSEAATGPHYRSSHCFCYGGTAGVSKAATWAHYRVEPLLLSRPKRGAVDR
jgi:hypothetical protein